LSDTGLELFVGCIPYISAQKKLVGVHCLYSKPTSLTRDTHTGTVQNCSLNQQKQPTVSPSSWSMSLVIFLTNPLRKHTKGATTWWDCLMDRVFNDMSTHKGQFVPTAGEGNWMRLPLTMPGLYICLFMFHHCHCLFWFMFMLIASQSLTFVFLSSCQCSVMWPACPVGCSFCRPMYHILIHSCLLSLQLVLSKWHATEPNTSQQTHNCMTCTTWCIPSIQLAHQSTLT